jgi:hypothetical protein
MNTLSINDEVRKKVPDGHMVVANNAGAFCFAVDLTTRDTMRQRAEKIKYD